MADARKRRPKAPRPLRTRLLVPEDDEPPHESSLTEVVAETLIARRSETPDQVPGEDDRLRAGDPDVDPLENELYGEAVPGASLPTPDQAGVDEIGVAYGLEDHGTGALVLGDEVLARRDLRRWESEDVEEPSRALKDALREAAPRSRSGARSSRRSGRPGSAPARSSRR